MKYQKIKTNTKEKPNSFKGKISSLSGLIFSPVLYELPKACDGPCFVATAVYKDPNALEVEILREFRDNVLMGNRLGKKVVEFYYSGFGKKTAEIIKNYTPSLIPVIKKGLDYIIETYKEGEK